MKGALAHQVGAHGVAPVQDLAVGPLPAAIGARHPLEKVNLQRLLARPGWRKDAAILRQVIEPRAGHGVDKLLAIHSSLLSSPNRIVLLIAVVADYRPKTALDRKSVV